MARDLGSFGFNKSEFYKVLPEGSYEFTVTEKSGSTQTLSVNVDKHAIRSNGNYISLK
jgi:hypothetical protein